MIFITAIRMSAGGSRQEHITEVQWRNTTDNNTGTSTVTGMVTFIETPRVVQVEGPPAAHVGVRETTSGHKYIQTYADKVWTNNLLALPRF